MSDGNVGALASLQLRLGYSFVDPGLLELALRHRSLGGRNNERLEFLGDALLGFAVAEALLQRYPDWDEGALSRGRAALVRRETLAGLARELGLEGFLTLGSEALEGGVARRDRVLADAFEALVGAMSLDASPQRACQWIEDCYGDRLNGIPSGGVAKDAKTRLKEFAEQRGVEQPCYQVLEEPDQAGGDFRVSCSLALLEAPVSGAGDTRRGAEQLAASVALVALDDGG